MDRDITLNTTTYVHKWSDKTGSNRVRDGVPEHTLEIKHMTTSEQGAGTRRSLIRFDKTFTNAIGEIRKASAYIVGVMPPDVTPVDEAALISALKDAAANVAPDLLTDVLSNTEQ